MRPPQDVRGRRAWQPPHQAVLIGEPAGAEAGGSKPAWIRDMVDHLPKNPRNLRFNWSDFNRYIRNTVDDRWADYLRERRPQLAGTCEC